LYSGPKEGASRSFHTGTPIRGREPPSAARAFRRTSARALFYRDWLAGAIAYPDYLRACASTVDLERVERAAHAGSVIAMLAV
jgi:hypothetical protein